MEQEEHSAAVPTDTELTQTPAQSARKRIPWLASLLFLGLAVSAVAGVFETSVKHFPLILAFQPLILGMAGNAGTQSLAVTLRRVGVRGIPRQKAWGGILLRELRVAFLSACALGVISFFIVSIGVSLLGGAGRYALALAGCVSGAMCLSVTMAGITGALIPLVLCRLRVDPAVASGPLITTVNDIVAVLSYYGLAVLFLRPLI